MEEKNEQLNRIEQEQKNDKEWRTGHQVEDDRRFSSIDRAIKALPSQEDMDTAIDKATDKAISKHVNGHIKEMHKTLTDYIEEDKKWKETADPAVISYTKGSAFFSVLGAGVQYVLPILGLIGILIGVASWLKN